MCWPSIERHLLAPLASVASVTVVAHLYRQTHVVNPRSGEDAPLPDANYRPFEAFRTEIEDRPAGRRLDELLRTIAVAGLCRTGHHRRRPLRS